ncbi:hypothetical protein CCP3SC15_380020 [Gammaproteobacteria bacterium]
MTTPDLETMREKILSGLRAPVQSPFIPTGIIEPAIIAVGEGKWDVVNMSLGNKTGKTSGVANITRNIMWPFDKEYFDYPSFREWPYKDIDGKIIKRGRILGTKENVQDAGPIQTEITKWWPAGRFERKNKGHSYCKEITTDTGWLIDILSHEQKPKEHEGPLLSWMWIDEPFAPQLTGAIMTRFQKGGVLLLSQTPYKAGAMLDALDDLRAQGKRIIDVFGSVYDNDIKKGKSNKKGTRRGIMTTEEIENYVAGIPLAERPERVEGKATHKSGKVYPKFSRTVHVRDYDLNSDYLRSANHYMAMDPHDAYYPFMLWGCVTADENVVITNEWPTYRTMNSNFYDQIRTTEHCHYTVPQLCDVIKIIDNACGRPGDIKRFIDPRFAAGTKHSWKGGSTAGMIEEYAKPGCDIKFNMPPFEGIDKQRTVIAELLDYKEGPGGLITEPRLFVLPHCINFIRALERHFYKESSEDEAEDFKDQVDTLRYLLAGVGRIVYHKPQVVLPSQRNRSLDVRTPEVKNKHVDEIKDLSL